MQAHADDERVVWDSHFIDTNFLPVTVGWPESGAWDHACDEHEHRSPLRLQGGDARMVILETNDGDSMTVTATKLNTSFHCPSSTVTFFTQKRRRVVPKLQFNVLMQRFQLI